MTVPFAKQIAQLRNRLGALEGRIHPERFEINIGASQTLLRNGLTLPFSFPAVLTIGERGGNYELNNLRSSTYKRTPVVTYYLAPDGDNANDGLSAAEPKKSLYTLLTALNAAPPSGLVRIYMATGYYSSTDGPNTVNYTASDLEIIATGGYVYFHSGRSSDEWTLVSGNIYKRTGHSISGVFTWKFRNKHGAPVSLTHDNTSWANEAAVLAGLAAGSWTMESGNAYLRMPDDSAPDEHTGSMSSSAASGGMLLVAGKSLYIEGIRGSGRGPAIQWDNTVAGKFFVAKDCEWAGTNSASYDVVSIRADTGFIFFDRCRADHGLKDGFNYHQKTSYDDAHFVEYHCQATYNGSDAASNGSTAHESWKGVRIGGFYVNNYGRNVNDITEAETMNIGCVAGQSQASTAGQDVGYKCGESGTYANTPVMYCVNCRSVGGGANVYDYEVQDSGTLYLVGSSAQERGVVINRNPRANVIRK